MVFVILSLQTITFAKVTKHLEVFYTILIVVLASFGLSFVFIPALIALSNKLSLVDEAGKRKRHKKNTSVLGGVSIYLMFIVAFVVFNDIGGNLTNILILSSFSLLFAVGLYDDMRPMNAYGKFFFQFLIAFILVYYADIHFVSFFEFFGLSEWIIKLFTLVFIVFVINAYNLVDGINGLSAMLAGIALLGMGGWFVLVGEKALAYVAFAMLASIIAFLRYNLFNTKIFLGDNGSMLLGLSVVFFAINLVDKNQFLSNSNSFKLASSFGIVISAMAVPVFDTVRLFFIRPFYLNKSPFKADRNHLHHLLIRLNLSHLQSTFILGAFASGLFICSFFAQGLGNVAVLFISAASCMAILIALDYFIFNYYRRGLSKKTVFNEAFKIKEELGNPVIYEFLFGFSFFILAIAIPFHRVSSSIPTILIMLSFLIMLIRKFVVLRKDFSSVVKKGAVDFFKHAYSVLIISFVLFYLAHSLIFTGQVAQSVVIKILLLLYWLTLFQLEKIIRIKPRYLITAYLFGCAAFSVFILYISFTNFNTSGWEAFFYNDLLDHVKANPITHSLYFNLAIIFLGNNYGYLKNKLWKLAYLIMLMLFILMVILCGSKIGYIVLFISVLTSFFYIVRTWKLRVLAILLSVVLFGGAYQQIDYVNKKVKGFKWQLTRHEKIPMEHRLPRAIIWPEAKLLIKENFWTGVGVGQSVDALIERYEVIEYDKGIRERFNAHNQFLETFLQTGIFGFLLLITFFIYGYYVALKNGNVLYAVFLSIVIFYMLVESLFETQMGMVAFAFFNALFLSALTTHKKEPAITT